MVALADALLGLVDAPLILLHEEFELLDLVLVLLVHFCKDFFQEHLVASLGADTAWALETALQTLTVSSVEHTTELHI